MFYIFPKCSLIRKIYSFNPKILQPNYRERSRINATRFILNIDCKRGERYSQFTSELISIILLNGVQ